MRADKEVIMGSRGPMPVAGSTETARGRNTYQEPEPPDAEVVPPAWLDGEALAYWHETAPPLVAAGQLRAVMATPFAVACQLATDCERLGREVAAEGMVVNGRANPKARLLRDARRDLLQYSRAFGLDSNSSARLPRKAEPAKANPLAVYIARGGA
ncbi:MAG: Phage terminase, small subunit [Planctomycetota bacterium]|jgi:phage terminase small subunit